MRKWVISMLAVSLLTFYIGIIMYVFFAILHIETLANFKSAMAFEITGFILLVYLVIGNILSKRIKTGFFVPLVLITVIYTVVLDVVNIAFIMAMPHVFFVLLNFILLLVYCLISIPMYTMGKR